MLPQLVDLVGRGPVAVLTGAGISTESGIPDYRGPTGATLRRHTPMTYQDFTRDPQARRRYWARSHLGWRAMSAAAPNDGHRALVDLEQRGIVGGIITQNVDGLHSAAGSERVIDLHGRLDRVICLTCGDRTSRVDLERRLTQANAQWHAQVVAHNPDGDADLSDDAARQFTVVDCTACGGVLKPDVVYFGENVPPARVHDAYALVESAAALLVLGSSLHVFSGRRFVQRAASDGIPIAIVNQGPTRADEIADVKLDAPLGSTLIALATMAASTTGSARTTEGSAP